MGRSPCKPNQHSANKCPKHSTPRCLLVEPVPDHLAGPEAADLDALAAPPLLAVEDRVACPAHLALSREADASCEGGNHAVSQCLYYLTPQDIQARVWKGMGERVKSRLAGRKRTSTLDGNLTCEAGIRILVQARVQGFGEAFVVHHRQCLPILRPRRLDLGDADLHYDQPRRLDFVEGVPREVVR